MEKVYQIKINSENMFFMWREEAEYYIERLLINRPVIKELEVSTCSRAFRIATLNNF